MPPIALRLLLCALPLLAANAGCSRAASPRADAPVAREGLHRRLAVAPAPPQPFPRFARAAADPERGPEVLFGALVGPGDELLLAWGSPRSFLFRATPARPELRWALDVDAAEAPRFLDDHRLLWTDGPDSFVLDERAGRVTRLDGLPRVARSGAYLIGASDTVVAVFRADDLSPVARIPVALDDAGAGMYAESTVFADGRRANVRGALLALDEGRVLAQHTALRDVSPGARRALACAGDSPDTGQTLVIDTETGAVVRAFAVSCFTGATPGLDASGRWVGWAPYADATEDGRVGVIVGDVASGKLHEATALQFRWSTALWASVGFDGDRLCLGVAGKSWSSTGCPFRVTAGGRVTALGNDHSKHEARPLDAIVTPPHTIRAFAGYRVDLDAGTVADDAALAAAPDAAAAWRPLRPTEDDVARVPTLR